MDKLLSLGIVITAKNLAGAAFGKASEQIGGIGKSAELTKAKIAGLTTATYAFGKSAAVSITQTYQSYADVAQAQGEIASLGIGESGIAAITKDAKAFSNQWAGTTKSDFIRASYDIKSGISSLSDLAVGKFTSMAALTAAATKSTTGEMTKLFALGHGIYRKQFGSDIEFGEQFSAAIAQSVKAFRTDGSDLSGGLSALGAVATSFGVNLSEQLAIIGTAKGAFNSASEAATSYRAFLNGAGKAQKELGLSFIDSHGKMLPMTQILKKIKNQYGDISKVETMDKIKKAFGSDEAVKMLTALIDKGGDLEKSIIDIDTAMQSGTKATEEMAKAMQKGKGMELLDQQLGNLSSTIGELFAPAVESVAALVGRISEWIGGLSEENKTLFGFIATGVTVVVGLVTVLSGLSIAVLGVTTAMGILGITTMATFGTITIIVGGLLLAGYALISTWEETYWGWVVIWDRIKTKVSWAWNGIKTLFSWSPLGLIVNNWGVISPYFDGVFNGIKAVASFAWGVLKTLFAWTPLGMIINNWGTISSVFGTIVDNIKKPFVEFFGWVGQKFAWLGNKVKSVAGFFANNNSSMLSEKPTTVRRAQPIKATMAIPTRGGTNNTVHVNISNPNFTSKEHAAQTQKQIDEQVRRALVKHANDKKDRSYS